ncbi:hypothetical protein EDF46_0122 [Frondihabitans sp. PhB188]|uniref:hypothetical protein n=1 Tax=Frondihabitans sp. PhB188 TaxID=2485200 RepID=UPI000F491B6E|nr:hypothetical protein [Frondihabitans sp. PhB188]ROQ40761.1 hypothetical protein EDF46_0122 [Frondihabitans sp. PhB188]
MPREFVLLTPEMPGDAAFRSAADAIGVPIALHLDAGGLLARFSTPESDPLVTVLHPQRAPGPDEIARILPGVQPRPGTLEHVWWSDVVVPWGAAQQLAVRLAEAIASALGGTLVDLASPPMPPSTDPAP